MTANDPYYLNLLINLALLATGAIAGFFTAKRVGQKDTLELKNELIKSLTQKVELLEKEMDSLKEKNEKLQSTIDDLVAMEEARKRVAQKSHRASAPPKKEQA